MAVAVGERAGVSARRALRKRLAPLYAAALLLNLALWVPIEKLFMTSIGFDAALVGVMAAVYSAAVPIFEVPSGVLADRWSRRGVLLLACLAAIVSVTIGGLSQNVSTYMLSAFFLGVFFAMQSGTFESIVYDTLLEETGSSDDFERVIARVRLTESIALVASALAGAFIAELVSLHVTYFLTAPLLIGAGVAVFFFREPRLHKAEESEPLRRQVVNTYRTLMQRGRLRVVVALTIAGALLMQGMLEFGPLWLVALGVAAVWYGPHWAGLTAALGIGGMLGSQPWMTRRWAVATLAALAVACSITLVWSSAPAAVIAAQVLLTVVVVAVSIPVMRRLHDAVPSTVRAGVASGVGTLTWVAFVPFALLVGFVSDRVGVSYSGWIFTAVAVVSGVLMVILLPAPAGVPVAAPVQSKPEPTFPPDRFLPDDDPNWPGHWALLPVAWEPVGIDVGNEEASTQVRAALQEMPAELRQVMILRDVEGRSPGEVAATLGISATEEQRRLHHARGRVRARLERYVERREFP